MMNLTFSVVLQTLAIFPILFALTGGLKSIALDVGFREDQSRACLGHSAEYMAVIRHIALSLLSHNKTKKGGIQAKRLTAGWDTSYLEKLLTQSLDLSKL